MSTSYSSKFESMWEKPCPLDKDFQRRPKMSTAIGSIEVKPAFFGKVPSLVLRIALFLQHSQKKSAP